MAPTLALTPGEPAGIGPDLCLQLAAGARSGCRLVALADPALLYQRASRLGLAVKLLDYDPVRRDVPAGHLEVLPIPLACESTPGRLDPGNAHYVLASLERAVDGCLQGEFAAMVTGPVQKSVINDAGIAFSGHTEFLAARCRCPRVVMMLATPHLRVALATTHLPLAAVPGAITRDSLETTLGIVHRDLRERFGIPDPRILVCGLNPHAGENGHLGREEIETIRPVVEKLTAAGMRLSGPLPADTLFTPQQLRHGDAVLAMYHDQGLPVLKAQGFVEAVNITLGLPIIRTSVDHGTALDLAGTGQADSGSLAAAVSMAAMLAGKADPA